MITIIIIMYLFMALWMSFSEMKNQTPKEAFKCGFSFPILLTVAIGGVLLMGFLGMCLLIGLFAVGVWIYSNLP